MKNPKQRHLRLRSVWRSTLGNLMRNSWEGGRGRWGKERGCVLFDAERCTRGCLMNRVIHRFKCMCFIVFSANFGCQNVKINRFFRVCIELLLENREKLFCCFQQNFFTNNQILEVASYFTILWIDYWSEIRKLKNVFSCLFVDFSCHF